MYQTCLALISTLLLLSACSSPQKCPYKPEPIFSEGLPHVVEYRFEREGAQSLETLWLDTQVLLEISQEVCRDTRQEFRFTVLGDYSQFADSMWLREAVRQLVFLSTLSPKQAPLQAWADVLEEARPAMRLGQEVELQPGIFARVDRIISSEQSTLILILAQREQ